MIHKLADYEQGIVIVNHADDTDFYKLTMKAAMHKLYPDAEAEFVFTCRTPGFDFRNIEKALRKQVELFVNLRYSSKAISNLEKVEYFSKSYTNFLSHQRWNPDDVTINVSELGKLSIHIKGTWINVTDWEIWLLTTISELRTAYETRNMSINELQNFWNDGEQRLIKKLDYLRTECPDLRFTDFGTRRRASKAWHERVLEICVNHKGGALLGTSNVYLAGVFDIPFFGTHAHEWDSAHLSFTHPGLAKHLAMMNWMEVFHGDCGITLTDTFTTDVFLGCFDKMLANAYTGVRHDSGPWRVWAMKILDHYNKLGIDPRTKTLLFSDGLDFETMVEIYRSLNGSCRVGFGIGTNLANDLEINALQIVIKLVRINGYDVLKLSDDKGKLMCINPIYRDYIVDLFGIGPLHSNYSSKGFQNSAYG